MRIWVLATPLAHAFDSERSYFQFYASFGTRRGKQRSPQPLVELPVTNGATAVILSSPAHPHLTSKSGISVREA